MPIYECCMFDVGDNVVSVEVLGDHDDLDARRAAMRAMVGSGRCARYEVWAEGRMVEAYTS
jgi:hypothetical protein